MTISTDLAISGYVCTVLDSETERRRNCSERASVQTRNATFGTISTPEQNCFAPFLVGRAPTDQTNAICRKCVYIYIPSINLMSLLPLVLRRCL